MNLIPGSLGFWRINYVKGYWGCPFQICGIQKESLDIRKIKKCWRLLYRLRPLVETPTVFLLNFSEEKKYIPPQSGRIGGSQRGMCQQIFTFPTFTSSHFPIFTLINTNSPLPYPTLLLLSVR